jgi:hypothetical protein
MALVRDDSASERESKMAFTDKILIDKVTTNRVIFDRR